MREGQKLLQNELLFLAASILLSSGPIAAQPEASDATFTIAISLPEANVLQGSRMRLDVTVNSNSKSVFILPDIRQFAANTVTILDADGNLVAPRNVPSGPIAGSHFGLFINPGKSHTESVYLSKTFDLNRPGSYSIQAHEKDRENGKIVYSNVVHLNVLP
jgi:hypothetical protein